MRLNDKQKSALIKTLQALKYDTMPCHFCHSKQWVITDAIFELREFAGGQINTETDSMIYPIIPLSCGKCGTTIFLNALALGLLDPTALIVKEG